MIIILSIAVIDNNIIIKLYIINIKEPIIVII